MFLLTASAASGQYANTETITTLHLILIAILIVLVIAGIIWGMRLKRARVEAEDIEDQRADELLTHPQTETAISPAPPPLGDAGMMAGTRAVTPAEPAPAAQPKATPKAAAPKPAAPKPTAAKPIANTPGVATAKPAAKAQSATPPAKAPAPRAATKPAIATKPAPVGKNEAKRAPATNAAAPIVKPAPKPAAKPAPEPAADAAPKATAKAAPKPAAAQAPAAQYGLIDVKGLGPKAVPVLEGMGVRTLADLAGLNAARATEIDGKLGPLSGRMARDKWVDQAKLLADGDTAAFEATYGKL